MRKGYKFFLMQLVNPELPEGILDRIIFRIQEEKSAAARRRIAVFSLAMVCSLLLFPVALKMARTDLSESGFSQFLLLVFSDFGIVAAYWQNFAMSLLETFPAFSFGLVLASVFIFMESLAFLARDIRYFFGSDQLINNNLNNNLQSRI